MRNKCACILYLHRKCTDGAGCIAVNGVLIPLMKVAIGKNTLDILMRKGNHKYYPSVKGLSYYNRFVHMMF